MKQIHRIAVHKIRDENTLTEFEAREYSLMKYGDPIVARRSAIHLASAILNNKEILEKIRSHKITFIASSAYGIVPTASHAIASDVCRLISSIGLSVRKLKIRRDGDLATNHYGTLNAIDRKARMKTRKIYLDDESSKDVAGNYIIAIDDILVTGSHEQRLHEVFNNTRASDWTFAYLMQLEKRFSQTHPEFEENLNRAAVIKATDLLPFFQIPFGPELKFRVNSRALKFLLTTKPESPFDPGEEEKARDLCEFYSRLTDVIIAKIYRAAISSDGYINSEKFHNGFSILHFHVDQRSTVRRILKRISLSASLHTDELNNFALL